MNGIEGIMGVLEATMERPTMYGWFHLMWFGIVLLAIVVLCLVVRVPRRQTNNRVVLVCGVLMLLFEIYKQIVFTHSSDGTWEYQWYAFPFTFCSLPMYTMLLAAILRKGKVHDALLAFLATYGLLGGLCVYLFPSTVFIETIGINIQTMVHHGCQIVVGVFLLTRGNVSNKFKKTLLPAALVFAALVLLATALNEIMFYCNPAIGHGAGQQTFNMMEMSRHFDCTLPVFSNIQQWMRANGNWNVWYPFFLLLYYAAFTGGAALMLLMDRLVWAILKPAKKHKKRRA